MRPLEPCATRGGQIARSTPLDELPEWMTPVEARSWLAISRSTMYQLLRTNAVEHVRLGRLIRIHKHALVPLLEGH